MPSFRDLLADGRVHVFDGAGHEFVVDAGRLHRAPSQRRSLRADPCVMLSYSGVWES